jgi:hypothetical protein
MSDVEKKILQMFDGAKPVDEDLFETSHVNHIAWTLVVLLCGVVFWFGIALVNAENQRNALISNQCADPVFKGQVDQHCLAMARSREHWWEHLWYGVTHLSPAPAAK